MPAIPNQAETARSLGYGNDVEAMNRDHDQLHGWLTMALGVPSWSLALARGEPMTIRQRKLAELEEQAVMACQRLRQMARNEPTTDQRELDQAKGISTTLENLNGDEQTS